MKKLILAVLLLASPLFADTTTSRMGLVKPDESSTGWGPKIRADFDVIDSSVAVLSKPNYYSAYNEFTSSVAFSSSTFNRVLIATPTYSISTDKLAVNGVVRVGGPGSLQVCNASFQSCSGLTNSILSLNSTGNSSVSIEANGAVNPTMLLLSSLNHGIESMDTNTSLPNLVSGKSVWIGSTFGDRFTETMSIDQAHSTFESPIYIGTHTVSGTPMLGVVGNPANTYSLLVGTSPTLAAGDNHFSVGTDGSVAVPKKLSLPYLASTTQNYIPMTRPTSGDLDRVASINAGIKLGLYMSDATGLTLITTDTLRTAGFTAKLVNLAAETSASNYVGFNYALTGFNGHQGTGSQKAFNAVVTGAMVANYGLYADVSGASSLNYALYDQAGLVHLEPLTASLPLQLDSGKNIIAQSDFGMNVSFSGLGGVVISNGVTTSSVTVSTVTATGYVQLGSKTLLSLKALTPSAVGQKYYCSDCATDAEVISTGTTAGAWSRVSARTTTIQ